MKLGAQSGRLVACAKSKHHGFHPSGEYCSYCGPPALYIQKNGGFGADEPGALPMPATVWFVDLTNGKLVDPVAHGLPVQAIDKNPHFVRLYDVKPGTVEAKRLCGCESGGTCRKYEPKTASYGVRVCDDPGVITDPNWAELT